MRQFNPREAKGGEAALPDIALSGSLSSIGPSAVSIVYRAVYSMRRHSGSMARVGLVAVLLACSLGGGVCEQQGQESSIRPDDGVIRGQILSQPRRGMPEHKRKLLEKRYGGRFATPSTRKGKHLRGLTASQGEVPVHAGYGTHYSFVYVGTPPQRQSVILDTGSHWTAFPCASCTDCGENHTDPKFKIDHPSYRSLKCAECLSYSSMSCREDQCGVALSYVEGDGWAAVQAEDDFWLGSDAVGNKVLGGRDLSIRFVFGCQYHESGLFRTQLEDGIMGLANFDITIVPTLKARGKISQSLFALCFTEDGGLFTMGGYDKAIIKSPAHDVQWTPMLTQTGFYQVQLIDIKIGGTSIGVDKAVYNSGEGTIVDSGTTDTYLPTQLAESFKRVFLEKSGGVAYSSDNMAVSEAILPRLPTITFEFDGGAKVDMQPDSYIECYDQAMTHCNGGIFLDNIGGAVLGANFMMNHEVVFDMDNKKVGFAAADCTYKAPK